MPKLGHHSLAEVEDYIRLRFSDDCHVSTSALYDEVVPLGYPSFVRQIRVRGLHPPLRRVRGMKGRDTIEIDHPAGEEIQWDWFGRRNAPWGAQPKSFSAPRPIRGATEVCPRSPWTRSKPWTR